MSKGLKRFTVQEAVQPYVRSIKPIQYDSTDAETIASTTYEACRAVVNETSSPLTGVTLTLVDKSTVVMTLNAGEIYPLSVIRTGNAGVTFLY